MDLFQASASRDHAASARILDLLDRTPWPDKRHSRGNLATKKQEDVSSLPSKEPIRPSHHELDLPSVPPKHSILDRPRPHVSGIRRIPRLMIASNFFPMLRVKKPQPAALSGIIKKRIRSRNLRHDRLEDLNKYWLPLSAREDQWEGLLRRQFGSVIGGDEEPSWQEYVLADVRQIVADAKKEERAARHLTLRLQEIVVAETELAKKERKQRMMEKKTASGNTGAAVDEDTV